MALLVTRGSEHLAVGRRPVPAPAEVV